MPEAAGRDVGGPWPFEGRASELERVREALLAAPARSTVVVGAAGVGKTRLAREAQGALAAAGRPTRWLTATHATARTPLGVFTPLIDSSWRTGDTAEDLLRVVGRELVGLDDDRGLVLVLDDAQLLDETSAGLVQQMVANRALPVLLTVRAGEPLPDAVTALWKDDLALRLELTSLGDQAGGLLLASVLGGPLDPDALTQLLERSQGNTLFLRELVVGAVTDGTLVDELGLWRLRGPLAPSERLVELVEARMRGLAADQLALLKVVAYGEPLGRSELATAGAPALVDGLVAQGLLTCELDGRRLQVRLAHPVYADVLRTRTSLIAHTGIAGRLSSALEAGGARRHDDVLRLGQWRLDGGGGSAQQFLHAARTARWHYDFALAERLALAAADAGGGFSAALLAAQSAMLQGRPADADRQFGRLLDQAGSDRERADLALAHVDCLWFYLGRTADGLGVAERAEKQIVEPGPRGDVSARRAGLLLGSAGPGAAAQAAVPLLDQATGRSLVWVGLVASYGLGRLGRLGAALDAADRGFAAGAHLLEPGDWYPWFNLYARCEALAHGGRLVEAERLALEQYDRGLQEGSSEARAWFLWNLCRSTRERGDVTAAVPRAREAVTLLRRLSRVGFEHSLLSLLALAHALAGDAEDAADALEAISELGVEPPMWSRTDHLAAQAWTEVARGRLAPARALLLEAADVGEASGDLVGAAAALHDVARLSGDRAVSTRLTRLAGELEGALVASRAQHAQALVTRDADRLLAVSAAFAEQGAHLLAAEAAADAAEALRAAGWTRAADRALARAGALVERCPGARTPALAPLATRQRLTPRERETALLAAAGRSSRDIAEELHLSTRTVENRLQHVYAKLGISSRSELRGLLGSVPDTPLGT